MKYWQAGTAPQPADITQVNHYSMLSMHCIRDPPNKDTVIRLFRVDMEVAQIYREIYSACDMCNVRYITFYFSFRGASTNILT